MLIKDIKEYFTILGNPNFLKVNSKRIVDGRDPHTLYTKDQVQPGATKSDDLAR